MKIVTANPQYNRPGVWYFEQPEFFTFEGNEVQVKWLKPDEIALSTDNPEFPFRVIKRHMIVSIDNKSYEQKNTTVKTFSVKGSKGDTYTVTVGSGKYHCTCSGFQFRKTCKHITKAEYA